MPYLSTKTYGHNIGLSCCFRQWRATHSHCSKLHGYALQFKFIFEADFLDGRHWVIDFGGLKELKHKLELTFDHKLAVAEDDPNLEQFVKMQQDGLCDLVIMPAVGCEKFAELAYGYAVQMLIDTNQSRRVRVVSCEVSEHGANSAIFTG